MLAQAIVHTVLEGSDRPGRVDMPTRLAAVDWPVLNHGKRSQDRPGRWIVGAYLRPCSQSEFAEALVGGG